MEFPFEFPLERKGESRARQRGESARGEAQEEVLMGLAVAIESTLQACRRPFEDPDGQNGSSS